MASPEPDLTGLLRAWAEGDLVARDRVVPVVYAELHRQARRYLGREAPGITLQTTDLVHEAYLRLVGQHSEWRSRAQFFGLAGQLMRRILVDHARMRGAAKRGGSAVQVSFKEEDVGHAAEEIDLVDLDEALVRLAARDPQQSRIVELRYFSGLAIEETAEVLGISPATVKRDWVMARAWLKRELGER